MARASSTSPDNTQKAPTMRWLLDDSSPPGCRRMRVPDRQPWSDRRTASISLPIADSSNSCGRAALQIASSSMTARPPDGIAAIGQRADRRLRTSPCPARQRSAQPGGGSRTTHVGHARCTPSRRRRHAELRAAHWRRVPPGTGPAVRGLERRRNGQPPAGRRARARMAGISSSTSSCNSCEDGHVSDLEGRDVPVKQ
jgi:hypothetical protein